MVKTIILAAVGVLLATPAAYCQLTFSGNYSAPVTVQPGTSTGLEAIYVLENTAGVTMSYTATSSSVTWSRFSNLGGGFAEPIGAVTKDGNVYSVPCTAGDMGYIVEDGGRQHCYWIVDYSRHSLEIDGVSVSAADSDCSRTALNVSGKGDAIMYYSVTGRGVELNRDITVSYHTLVYDDSQSYWRQGETSAAFGHLSSVMVVDAPLCDTEFTVSGDRFLRAWGYGQQAVSTRYSTPAVDARTSAVQTEREIDNENKPETGALGGSAPCEITFTAIPSDAVVFKEWQFSNTETFDDVLDRFQQDELVYTFTDQGSTYVRYVGGNAEGTCYYESEVYTVSIGESKLECPNAFSPGNQDGVNDEWKVSYTSLVSFECNIYNRWGTKMATLTNPSQGWDGKYNGKFVPAGVYFYVIKAIGADGVKYNKSGDINIINSRRNTSGGSLSE